MSVFTEHYVELKFRDKIYGGLPGSREVFEKWMEGKFAAPENTENTETDLDLDKEIQENTNQFRCDERGIYIGAYQIKAMIAQCGSLLELTTTKRGSKQTLKEGTFVKGIDADGSFTGDKVYLLPLQTEANGSESFTGTVYTPHGTRSIITHTQYCLQPTIRFQMWMLTNRLQSTGHGKKLNFVDFQNILQLGQEVGLGAMRNMEAGKFDVVAFQTWDDHLKSNGTA